MTYHSFKPFRALANSTHSEAVNASQVNDIMTRTLQSAFLGKSEASDLLAVANIQGGRAGFT